MLFIISVAICSPINVSIDYMFIPLTISSPSTHQSLSTYSLTTSPTPTSISPHSSHSSISYYLTLSTNFIPSAYNH